MGQNGSRTFWRLAKPFNIPVRYYGVEPKDQKPNGRLDPFPIGLFDSRGGVSIEFVNRESGNETLLLLWTLGGLVPAI